MKRVLLALSLTAPALCFAKSPPCSHWPMKMAEAVLTEAGLTASEKLDDAKTTAVRLASEQIGRDLYQQIYRITFHEKGGQSIEVVTNSQASSKECSMGSVDVFVVSKQFNSDAAIKRESP
ncbi:hypothetical protein [Paraburkholderia acidisoli]|uniref:Uncharacterized protein n=1 Tax=Paraburkholderia acidisoli TaxID=2571748 RepID=A0A7Z2GH10_9BURK|nr:hypothetical protein [Paraburkholderia acidisoli]QGZ61646.1 hypothetical protein FAZ98_07795 [Paraburkholderia acidisoli]